MTPAQIMNAEEVIIGLVQMRGAAAVEECVNLGLNETHFLDRLAQKAFQTASIMSQNGVKINFFTLLTELGKNNLLDEAERIRFPKLGDAVSGREDLGHYVSLIVENARLRSVQRAAAAFGNGADCLDDLKAALTEMESDVGAARTSSPLVHKIREYIDLTNGVFTTHQLCADLNLFGEPQKKKVRMALSRLKGNMIEAAGNRAGTWRKIDMDCSEIDLSGTEDECVNLWLPLDLHVSAEIYPGNIILIVGSPNSGKTGFLLRTACENLKRSWKVAYFSSEMGATELSKRLQLFRDGFPMGCIETKQFRAYERSDSFQDVIKPGKGSLNIIDFLECYQDFYAIGGALSEIHKKLDGAIALIAVQMRDTRSGSPLGGLRTLEKPRLAVALNAGNPNFAQILKLKNRRVGVAHSLDRYKREFKLVNGSEFLPTCADWHP